MIKIMKFPNKIGEEQTTFIKYSNQILWEVKAHNISKWFDDIKI